MARHTGCPECQPRYSPPVEVDDGDYLSAEPAKTEDQDSNGRTSPPVIFNPFYTGRPRSSANGNKTPLLDRLELIRRIKSRESRPTSPELERSPSTSSWKKRKSPSPEAKTPPAVPINPVSIENPSTAEDVGMQIERPRSALHRGDFHEKGSSTSEEIDAFRTSGLEYAAPALSTSPVAPWHAEFPHAAFRQHLQPYQTPSTPPGLPLPPSSRTRAISTASFASNFTYKPPTSPLAQASRPDTPDRFFETRSHSPDKTRRHTFSPQSFRRFPSSFDASEPGQSGWRNPPPLRSEMTFPYQAHQPRRSINSFSLPQTPFIGARRRPSLSDSPLHLAPMVGSYEESILRGRMSTMPSKPLNFIAQIGVLGKGDCKPNLKCPPHVTVPFPAVFYSYGAGAKGIVTDQPSPYVGHVDLESHLPSARPSSEKRRHKRQSQLSDHSSRASSRAREDNNSASDAQAQTLRRQRQKQKRRRSRSPKAPPGGSYRIPQQGQIQVVIKNPNKTAVKLFLIPYDLSDMEPGQKTFIRQRSYSAGPILDMPMTVRTNLGTDRPEASLNASDDPNGRPMLRYLIHLHMCCPSKGRYYLYKSIRVVFANRVPDGKEKLRNEIQLPEPRYSAYKPGRETNAGLNSSTHPSKNARDRSPTPVPSTPHPPPPHHPARNLYAQSLPTAEYDPSTFTLFPHHQSPISFHHLPVPLPTLDSRPSSRQMSDIHSPIDSTSTFSPKSQFTSPTHHPNGSGPVEFMDESSSPRSERRRLEAPLSFEREGSRERSGAGLGLGGLGGLGNGRNESILSQRLRDLAVLSMKRREHMEE